MGLGIGELIEPIQSALAPVGGTLSDIWQGVVGDRIAAWRLKNAMALQDLIFEEAKRCGVTVVASKVPERYAFAWFEEATKQDEPEIQKLFSRLLFRASLGDNDALDRRLISILGQFTPLDAKVFRSLFAPSKRQAVPMGIAKRRPIWDYSLTAFSMEKEFGEESISSLEHLINLGIVVRSFKIEPRQHFNVGRLSSNDDARRIAKEAIRDLRLKDEISASSLGCILYAAINEEIET